MNAADCSVNNNPLVHLNKHTQQNEHNLLPHRGDLGVGSSNALINPSASLKSSQNIVSERNLREINNFQNGSINNMGSMKFGQAPIRTDTGSNWNAFNQVNQQTLPAHFVENLPVNKQWSDEFKTNNHKGNFMERQPSGKVFQNNLNSNITNFRSPMFQNVVPQDYRSRTGTTSTLQQNSQLNQKQEVETDWDQQFGDLEREVSQNLKIDENVKEVEGSTQRNDSSIDINDVSEDIIIDDTYQADFQKVWDDIHADGEDFMPDRSKYMLSRMTGNLHYEFEDSKNEYLNNPNAYKIGCILMENGAKLSEAAMAFEAAVQETPDHIDAWLKLGLVQIQNEKELNGICALEKCLKLDGKNLEAMKTLAISYINEGYDMSALTILNQWISTKYPNIELTTGLNNEKDSVLIDETLEENTKIGEKIKQKFLALSKQLPQVDPDVELCLGLLYYADDNYDVTIDCFNRALKANPNDESMWNRLGAALANSNRSEESITAYHKALNLKPSFVRARYNLAVSCMNIGCYKESAEHLLTTLSMHEVEGEKFKQGHEYNSWNNDNIIETLKRVFVAMNRNDLLEKVQPGMDLKQFKGEFAF
ncbi:similar to Saccharomyces cerevisiae YDR244W PEX5 Peroxisomal membrane signal receptor for the C-terminal tripeptide signal sequence (PTS1) of peroxisomal matrix proteins [Maudiozyma saulgeensis]|uniref:Similar to Saccharomyces cerevisiae YDR244W PEX5 Peroxisomal membrane signal receptor for the C-terminal tripeptide signal sequence (PTS1) of peroxisomal matrix proteins n=1 Tax=Maudiozyma saulgeensis TaxID=1789683 RepID=A0A1X7R637_9SACH|nr:similar to Saccharomyces cerevisiae YDR244W PEX5 Peroxisomal membrane signal receptor for the C-terminal tripeptide signal sequence (PTS1) of peroxisomal matrix proteins [Kazachstania saulgeensis]